MVGLFWFTVKVFTFVFIFVWMRGTLPRVRIDQLMGFAWKWLVEIALLNIFVTAGAILLVQELQTHDEHLRPSARAAASPWAWSTPSCASSSRR